MAVRGSQVSFMKVFYEETTPVINITKNSGRNKELNSKRNECLLDRYYFIAKSTGKRFDLCIGIVAAEFFISDFHASKIILQHPNMLTALKIQWKAEPVEKMQKHFAKKWAHLVW